MFIRLKSGTVLETSNPESWPEGERLTAKEGARLLREEALASLRKTLNPGDTVYTINRHTSSSGMMREISMYAIKDNQPVWLDGYAGRLLGLKVGKREGLRVGGCGMDMGFHLVYSLSAALFEKGPDGREPGYALNHRWM